MSWDLFHRYAFLLGVIPATLATLLVLGHSPLQLLLVGAYAVTVYVLNFESGGGDGGGDAGATRAEEEEEEEEEEKGWLDFVLPRSVEEKGASAHKKRQEKEDGVGGAAEGAGGTTLRFLELLKWLDRGPLAPLLNEDTMVLLYRVSCFLDSVNGASSEKDDSGGASD